MFNIAVEDFTVARLPRVPFVRERGHPGLLAVVSLHCTAAVRSSLISYLANR